jgi:hypothetical protein
LPEPISERIRHYVLDGSDRDLRRLLSVAEVQAESARAAIRRIGDIAGWQVSIRGGHVRVAAERAPITRRNTR